MTQKESINFLGRCTTLGNGNGYWDKTEIKQQANSLVNKQTQQQEILVHIISILNITIYTTWVNRQMTYEVMDVLQKANQHMNILLNVTDVLTQCLRYHQIYTYAHTILAYLRDCLTYMKQVATHRWIMWMPLHWIYYHWIYSQLRSSKVCSGTLSHNYPQ